MPQLLVPNGVQVKIYWQNATEFTLNVMGATTVGAHVVNQAMADALDTSIKSAFTSSGLSGRFGTVVKLLRVSVRSVHSGNLPEFYGAGAEVPGAGTGDVIPRGAACVVTLRTDRAGKSYVGRQYVTGYVESESEAGNQITSAASVDTTDFYTSVKSALSGNGLTMAVLSPALPERQTKAGSTLPAKPAEARPVQSMLVRNRVWASQRNRNGRT
jgi:hypothetical protein